MLFELENSTLKITADEHGGELKSVTSKKDGTEYLWNSDPTWWKYSAPVLFPIVGKLVNGKYRAEGKEFDLPGHGFARTSDFECVREDNNEIVFRLNWSDNHIIYAGPIGRR